MLVMPVNLCVMFYLFVVGRIVTKEIEVSTYPSSIIIPVKSKIRKSHVVPKQIKMK